MALPGYPTLPKKDASQLLHYLGASPNLAVVSAKLLLRDNKFRAILDLPASSPRGFFTVHGPAAAGLFPGLTQEGIDIMDLCDECAKLQGCSADRVREEGMTLVGVGQCEGVVAIEHYRCEKCQTVMVRQLCGCSTEQVWTAIS
jgi:hypothetical protein